MNIQTSPDGKIRYHEDTMIGMTMGSGVHYAAKTNIDGSEYWVATQAIGSIFGSAVEGECRGIGRTKEQALEKLKADQKNLNESLWA